MAWQLELDQLYARYSHIARSFNQRALYLNFNIMLLNITHNIYGFTSYKEAVVVVVVVVATKIIGLPILQL